MGAPQDGQNPTPSATWLPQDEQYGMGTTSAREDFWVFIKLSRRKCRCPRREDSMGAPIRYYKPPRIPARGAHYGATECTGGTADAGAFEREGDVDRSDRCRDRDRRPAWRRLRGAARSTGDDRAAGGVSCRISRRRDQVPADSVDKPSAMDREVVLLRGTEGSGFRRPAEGGGSQREPDCRDRSHDLAGPSDPSLRDDLQPELYRTVRGQHRRAVCLPSLRRHLCYGPRVREGEHDGHVERGLEAGDAGRFEPAGHRDSAHGVDEGEGGTRGRPGHRLRGCLRRGELRPVR